MVSGECAEIATPGSFRMFSGHPRGGNVGKKRAAVSGGF
jgi:hypothetical protein